MRERRLSERRVLWTRALALATCVGAALGPAAAAARADVTVTADVGVYGGEDDALAELPNPRTTFVTVTVTSTADCTQGIQLLASGAAGGGGSVPGTVRTATFVIRYDRPQTFVSEDHEIRAECKKGLGFFETGSVIVPIKKWRPAPPPEPDRAAPAAQKKRKRAAKNGAAATKQTPRAPLRAAGPRALAAPVADVYSAIATRELEASVALNLVDDLPLPHGPIGAPPTPAAPLAPPPLPPLPAGVTADVGAVLGNLSEQVRLGDAAVESLARLVEADRLGDATAVTAQRAAAADLVDRWASALGAAAPLRAAAQAGLAGVPGYGPVTVTQAEADAIAKAIPVLPADVAAQLTADHATADAVAAARAAFRQAHALVQADVAPTLVDADQDFAESTVVVQLRALAAALRSPAGGGTSTPVPGRRLPHGVGELRPVSCVAAATAGCTHGRALSDTAFVAVSSNGRFVYVSSRGGSAAVTGFRRHLATGRLTPIAGPRGCVSANAADGCQLVAGIATPSQIAIGPASRDLYLASGTSNAVFAFRIAKGTGRLTPNGCLTDGQPGSPTAAGCTVVAPVIGNLKNLAISPDGRHVYAPSYSWGIISIFARDRGNGRLRYVGCVGDARRGCTHPAPLLNGPRGITVMRDGRTVVVADQGQSAAIGFDRDPATGWLTESSCVAGTGAYRPPPGCAAGVAISGPENVAVGSAADEVIVSSTGISSLVRLRRDPATGTLRVVDAGAPCVTDRTDAATALCRSHPGLSSTYGVALSPDGQQVYTASYTPGAVGAFAVDPRTRELVGVGPCFSSSDTGCAPRAGLARAGGIAIAPDARHVYVAAPDSSTVTAFARRMVVVPVGLARGRPRITRQGGVDVDVSCPSTMVGWCVGTATGRVVGRRGVRIAAGATPVIVPSGTTRRVRLAFPRRIRALAGRVRVEVRATMREPFGATARSRARIVVRA